MVDAESFRGLIAVEPDVSLEGPTFRCPECHVPVNLFKGALSVTCEKGHSDSWHHVYAFTVRFWAVMAYQAYKEKKQHA